MTKTELEGVKETIDKEIEATKKSNRKLQRTYQTYCS